MPDRTRDIEFYQNEGALITLGAAQIISFTRFDTSTSATVTFQDSAPNNGAWNAGESATIGGDPAILLGTGLSFAGVKVTILGITLANIQLSTPVRTALLDVDGSQMLHFYNADGTEADPGALLDALASQLVTSLSGAIPPLPRPGMSAMSASDRLEIMSLFPDLCTEEAHHVMPPARKFLVGHIAKSIVARAIKNTSPVVEPRRYTCA